MAYQTNESGEFQIVVQPDLLHRARRQADGSFHRRPGLNIRGGHASGAFSGITREQRPRIQQAGVRRLPRRPIPHQPARRSRHAAASYHADFKLASEAVILAALRRGDRRRIPERPRIRESVPH